MKAEDLYIMLSKIHQVFVAKCLYDCDRIGYINYVEFLRKHMEFSDMVFKEMDSEFEVAEGGNADD